MKKIVIAVFCIILVFSLTSCNYEKREQEIASMFDSFEKSENIVLLTCFELVVNGTHYDLEDIKYNEQRCVIVYLEENGFYSFVYNQDTLSVEFLYTLYETFETTSLGTEILPSQYFNSFWGDDCFWFRIGNPENDRFQHKYYSWNIHTKQVEIVDSDSISDN